VGRLRKKTKEPPLRGFPHWASLTRVMSDVIQTEHRKQAEEEFRRLRDVLPQYMCVYDADATPLYANDNLLDFFGFTLGGDRPELKQCANR